MEGVDPWIARDAATAPPDAKLHAPPGTKPHVQLSRRRPALPATASRFRPSASRRPQRIAHRTTAASIRTHCPLSIVGRLQHGPRTPQKHVAFRARMGVAHAHARRTSLFALFLDLRRPPGTHQSLGMSFPSLALKLTLFSPLTRAVGSGGVPLIWTATFWSAYGRRVLHSNLPNVPDTERASLTPGAWR